MLIILLNSLLFACSSPTKKEETPVEVTDLNQDGVETFGSEQGDTSEFTRIGDGSDALSVRTIYFEYDSSDIKPEYQEAVVAHGSFLAQNPSAILTLEGHADERGSREYNLALGEQRAESVKQQMLLHGAISRQVRVVSYGEERPLTTGHDEAAWQQNRRADILY